MDLSLSQLLEKAKSLQDDFYANDQNLAVRLAQGLIRKSAQVSGPEWQPHKFIEGNRTSARDQLLCGVDCLLYAISLLSIQDCDKEALLFLIEAKQAMVSHLHETCRKIQEIQKKDVKNIVVLDIDGVMFPYPSIRDQFCVNCGAEDYESAKELYRLSGIKAVVPPLAGAKELISFWRETGKTIVALSSRPVDQYPEVYIYTERFFQRFGMSPDLMVFKKAKHISSELDKLWPHVEFFIDDELPNLKEMKKLHPHINCVHISSDDSLKKIEGITRYSSTQSFYDWIKQQN